MTTRRWSVYLLHFSEPYRHARHYLGTTADVGGRVLEHLSGSGSPLVKAAVAAGISVSLVRTWRSGGRRRERALKRSHNVPRLCPVCKGGPHPVEGVHAYSAADAATTARLFKKMVSAGAVSP